MLKDAGFKKNFNVLDIIQNSIERAASIPDQYVQFAGGCRSDARVRSSVHETHWYHVRNADCEWASCDCDWAQRGNVCKHQIKVMSLNGLEIHAVIEKSMDLYNAQFHSRELRELRSHAGNTRETSSPLLQNENLDAHEDIGPPQAREDDVHALCSSITELAGCTPVLLGHARVLLEKVKNDLDQFKASLPDVGGHPCFPLQRLDDGFSNSIRRARPFFERGGRRQAIHQASEVNLQPFPCPGRRKRATMQTRLDVQGRASVAPMEGRREESTTEESENDGTD